MAPSRRPQIRRVVALGVFIALACAALEACGPAVVYRARPGFATSEDLPDEVTLPDGTVIRYVSRGEFLARKRAQKDGHDYTPPVQNGSSANTASAPSFVPWDESEDGVVVMQAIMPEHVVANAMRAFREERYGELWDQLVAENIRRRATRELELVRESQPATEDGAPRATASTLAREQFIAWCSRARDDVMTLLNRMSFGFSTNAIIVTKSGPTTLRLELTPQISEDFKYKIVDIEFEGDRVMLSGIH